MINKYYGDRICKRCGREIPYGQKNCRNSGLTNRILNIIYETQQKFLKMKPQKCASNLDLAEAIAEKLKLDGKK